MAQFERWEVEGGAPVFAWTNGVSVEADARAQVERTSKMPHVKRIAVMPDMHYGMGCTVGTAIAMQGAVSPAVVGVDIGCGMDFVKTNLRRENFSDLAQTRKDIERAVPSGFFGGQQRDAGSWHDVPTEVQAAWEAELALPYVEVVGNAIDNRVHHKTAVNQLGTLGSGNHFIELAEDETGAVWVLIHSGSRGPGNKIGSYYTKLAQELCAKWLVPLPDKDLAYLPLGIPEYGHYLRAVNWAQKYASVNRRLMVGQVEQVLATIPGFEVLERNSCHHNFLEHAEYDNLGKVVIARKGAVKAAKGNVVLIPGSMGAKTYIARGKGSVLGMDTCSHGAGRTMSRTKARATISLLQHQAATAGVECDKTLDTVDESPGAYKDIDAVMAAQSDLVEPLHTLKQFLCVKGKDAAKQRR